MGPAPWAAADVASVTPGLSQAQRTAPLALAIAAVSGVLIALELLRPVHGVDASARAAVETAIAVAAVLTSRLLIGIFRRTRQLRELLLVLGVAALALSNFSHWVGPMIAGARGPAAGDVVRPGCELLGAFALAAAALVRPTVILKPYRGRYNAAVLGALGALAVAVLSAEVMVAHPASGPVTTVIAGGAVHPFMLVQVASALILAVAGLAFVARAWRTAENELLAGAALLLAAAGVQFVTVPTVAADWVTPREGARLVAFALLLGVTYLRYANVQRSRAHAAVRAERERVARDLHDGLAQDLACITAQAQRLDCQLDPHHPLVLASRDALGELRRMLVDLTASTATASEEAEQLVNPVDLAVSRRGAHVLVQAPGGADGVLKGAAGEGGHSRRVRGVSRFSAEWSRRARRPRVG